METIISDLLARFEKGSLDRRDLVRGLALLAASATTATAQEESDFKAANIDHVSIQVANLQRSVDFYQKMFGFTVVSEDKPQGIVRVGNGRVLVSFNNQNPAGKIDHFSIGIPRYNKEAVTRYLQQRGATVLQGDFAGQHIKDPDGVSVQISAAR
jgi:glyoxylase I family protein